MKTLFNIIIILCSLLENCVKHIMKVYYQEHCLALKGDTHKIMKTIVIFETKFNLQSTFMQKLKIFKQTLGLEKILNI